MAASTGIIGKGCSIAYSDTEGGSYTALADVSDLQLPPVEVAKVELTHYSSDSSAAEFTTGVWKVPGDVEVEANYTKGVANTLYGTLLGTSKWWKITFPDSSYTKFQGFVGAIGGTAPNKDKMTITFTVRITNNLTFTSS